MTDPAKRVTLTIPGRLPGLNEYIDAERGNRYAAAELKKDVQSRIILLIKQQIKAKFKNPVILTYSWVETSRRRDKSNIAFAKKFIEDALVNAGVLKNDGWNEIAGYYDLFYVDKHNPRVEVEIEEVEA